MAAALETLTKRRIARVTESIGLLALCLALVAVFAPVGPAQAQTPQPPIPIGTPTPDAEGHIYYVVAAGDNCTRIALLNNIPLDQLMSLNKLTAEECTALAVGQKLLLATVTVPTAANTPAISPTPSGPAVTPPAGYGTICVYLFDDANGNAVADAGEGPVGGAAISLTDIQGAVALNGQTTADGQPTCFDNLPEGQYNVTLGLPQGYNPTTQVNYGLSLKAGDRALVDFGAQRSSEASTTGQSSPRGISPVMAILGGVLLVAGVGLGVYAGRGMQAARRH